MTTSRITGAAIGVSIALLFAFCTSGCTTSTEPCTPRPLVLTDSTGVGGGEDGGAVVDSSGWCDE
jgi:hypothetical protein